MIKTMSRTNWCCWNFKITFLLLMFTIQTLIIGIKTIRIFDSAYHDINVEISETDFVQHENCKEILTNLEKTLSTASKTLQNALNGRYYFGSFNIHLPIEWNDACIPNLPVINSGNHTSYKERIATPSLGGKPDITLIGSHTIYGDKMWTEQYGSCGTAAINIYLPFNSINKANSGQTFAKEWAKFRYGVFDEYGHSNDILWPLCYFEDGKEYITGCSNYEANTSDFCADAKRSNNNIKDFFTNSSHSSLMSAPGGEQTTMFCDGDKHNRYAPTKQNFFCDRQPTMNIIQRHQDFSNNSVNTKEDSLTKFNYKRHIGTRYVVVIDDSLDTSVRESWHFLRSAFRKWVVYDLIGNSEVGVVLSNGKTIEKTLDLKPLTTNKNRDLVASFIPYTTSDVRDITCIGCAIKKAIELLENRQQVAGPASNVIIVIAPGLDPKTSIGDLKSDLRQNLHIRLTTINYPNVVKPRLPLDLLITDDNELYFSIFERKYNSEKSYLLTYFELTNALMKVGRFFYEGDKSYLPIEIHRNIISDLSNNLTSTSTLQHNTILVFDEFYVARNYVNDAEFYVYTHSPETPLIQTMRLISPKGSVFTSRSDQRLPVKQMMLIAPMNETGIWRYEVERYVGNPQPHIVQVLARPSNKNYHITTDAWVIYKNNDNENYFNLYCKVSLGKYSVIGAEVRATLAYSNVLNGSEQIYKIDLLDNGAGDSDIFFGDGIYSRRVGQFGPGIYTFDFSIKGTKKKTFSITNAPLTGVLNFQCCAGEILSLINSEKKNSYLIETNQFERYAQTFTYFVDTKQMHSNNRDTKLHMDNVQRLTPILTFQGNQKDDIVEFTWSHFDFYPNFGNSEYELRFSYKLKDIIDFYSRMELLATISFPSDSATTLVHLLNLSKYPNMYGKRIFFAVRAFGNGQISNVVSIQIPLKTLFFQLYQTTTPAHAVFIADDIAVSNTTSEIGILSIFNEHNTILSYALLTGLFLFLLLIFVFLIYFCIRCRRLAKKTKDQNRLGTTTGQAKPLTVSLNPAELNSSDSAYTLSKTIQNDHHILGIPTLFDKDSHKTNLSTIESFNIANEECINSNNYIQQTYVRNFPCNNTEPNTNSVRFLETNDYCSYHSPLNDYENAVNDGYSPQISIKNIVPPVPPLPISTLLQQCPSQVTYEINYNAMHPSQTNSPHTVNLFPDCFMPTTDQVPHNYTINTQQLGIPQILDSYSISGSAAASALASAPDTDSTRRRNVTMV